MAGLETIFRNFPSNGLVQMPEPAPLPGLLAPPKRDVLPGLLADPWFRISLNLLSRSSRSPNFGANLAGAVSDYGEQQDADADRQLRRDELDRLKRKQQAEEESNQRIAGMFSNPETMRAIFGPAAEALAPPQVGAVISPSPSGVPQRSALPGEQNIGPRWATTPASELAKTGSTYGPTPAFRDALVAGEGGPGGYNAMNAKGSGAFGAYQFMPQTWNDLAKRRPELNLSPVQPAQGFAMPPAAQQDAAYDAYLGDVKSRLQALGIEPTPANAAFAWRFGPDAAAKIIEGGRRDPSATMSSLVSSAYPDSRFAFNVIGQNNLTGQKFADYYGDFERRFGGTQMPQEASPQLQQGGQMALPSMSPQTIAQMAFANAMKRHPDPLIQGMGEAVLAKSGAELRAAAEAPIRQREASRKAELDLINAPPKVIDPTTGEQRLAWTPGDEAGYRQYQTRTQASGGGPMTEMSPQRKKYLDEQGKARSEQYDAARKFAADADLQIGRLDMLQSALDRAYEGPAAETIADIQAIGKEWLGIDIKGASAAQVAQSLSRGLALQINASSEDGRAMPGNFSNSDRQYLDSIVAGINKLPDANRTLIAYQKLALERRRYVANAAIAYVSNPQGPGILDERFDAMMNTWAKANPLFGESVAGKKAGALVNGKLYRLADGRLGKWDAKQKGFDLLPGFDWK